MVDNPKKIILVEDEQNVAEIVRDYMLAAGYSVELRHTGIGIVDLVRKTKPDLVLLDLMLPGIDGVTICKEIRKFSDVPIIMLTAKISELDRLLGYDTGADDYICKPVNPKEILARVKAVLRRFEPKSINQSEQFFYFDEDRFTATLKGNILDLTKMEYNLLQLLVKYECRVYSRGQIMDYLYDGDVKGSDRSADTHIKNLRKKIGQVIEGQSPIQSVYGLGYKLQWEYAEDE